MKFHKVRYQTKSATIQLIAPDIVENIIHDYAKIDLIEFYEIHKLNSKLVQGKSYSVLINPGYLIYVSKAVLDIISSKKTRSRTNSKAILVNSTGNRIMAEFYLKKNKPEIQTDMFSDRNEAIEWLSRNSNR